MSRALNWLRLPFEWLSLLSGAKNFQANAVVGSARLNRWGLHVLRKRIAHAIGYVYRKRIAARLPAADVAAFEAQGFLQLDNFLPEGEFSQVRDEICRGVWPLIEMAQPPAVTHRANLDMKICAGNFPALARLLHNPLLLDWMRYAAGYPGQPLIALQRITSDQASESGGTDPQADWHMDTFHSVGKGWLFLHSVDVQDGPFAYVPGSHRLTGKSLAWERQQSVAARQHPDHLHARGSFRANTQDLAEMGFADVYVAAVKPNTLVVADTGGLHRRMSSPGPTVRLEIYLSLRRNPFFGWCTPSLLGMPVIRSHWAGWAYALCQYLVRIGRPGWIPRPAQRLNADDRSRLDQRQED